MAHIAGGKIYHFDRKIGWIDGNHIRNEEDGKKLGYWENGCVYGESGHKIAYLHEDNLVSAGGRVMGSLERINEEIHGGAPILAKCAVKVLFDL